MLLIRLFSRTFMTAKSHDSARYNTIVVKEIPKYLNDQDTINIESKNYIDTTKKQQENKPDIQLKLVKLIKKKIDIMRSIRRQRYTRRVGYTQHIGYFQLVSVLES